MPKTAYFFDLNCFLKGKQQAWIVDRNNPSLPLLKITQSELKLFKSGIFKNKGNKIDFNGITYYLSDEVWNHIKIICSKNNINVTNLVISLQEFLNRDLINYMKFDIDLSVISNIKKDIGDLYLVCSKYTRSAYQKIVDELIESLRKEGIVVKNFYYLNENFMNYNDDELQYKKIKLILQHSIGYKSEKDKFIDDEITKYEIIHWYDKSFHILNLVNLANDTLKFMLNKSDKGLLEVIKDDLIHEIPKVFVHKIQDNQVNPIITKTTNINLPNVVRKFESFKFSL